MDHRIIGDKLPVNLRDVGEEKRIKKGERQSAKKELPNLECDRREKGRKEEEKGKTEDNNY